MPDKILDTASKIPLIGGKQM